MENQPVNRPWGIDLKAYCLLMHLAQFAGIIIPGAGIILPIVMWVTNKEQFTEVDAHGKNIVNWILSLLIYLVVSIFLMFVIIGFFLLFALIIVNIIFIIIGAVKANQNEVWEYPLSIKFFK